MEGFYSAYNTIMDIMLCLSFPKFEALTPNVTVSGDRPFEEVMKFN